MKLIRNMDIDRSIVLLSVYDGIMDLGWPTFVSNHFIIEESGSQFLIVVFQPDLIVL